MSYIVKSSLSIEPTIVAWNEKEREKLIKEKQEFLKNKEIIIEEDAIISENQAEQIAEEDILDVEAEKIITEKNTTSEKRGRKKVGEE